MIGARDRHLAGFQRLAQRIECLRLEFRNYVAVSPGFSCSSRMPSRVSAADLIPDGAWRGGDKPNPGTIYPALKDLARKGMIESHLEGRNNVYTLTEKGQTGLKSALDYFRKAFGEIFDSTLAISEGPQS